VGDGSEKREKEKRMGDRGYGRRYKRAHDYLAQPFFTFYGERELIGIFRLITRIQWGDSHWPSVQIVRGYHVNA